MSNIVQFPSKKIFREEFRGKVPDEILIYMLEAYDRVIILKNKYPCGTFHAAPGYEQEANRISDDFQSYTLMLLKRILELESELCLLQKA